MTPKGPYGESKAEAENKINEVWSSLDMNQKDSRHVYILRPCMMHGPGNKGNLNLLYKVVNVGLPWPLGAFENKTFFLFYKQCLFCSGDSFWLFDVKSGTYNLAR